MAAPDPTGTPGLPVPALLAPTNTSPTSPNTLTVPFPGCGWKVPAVPSVPIP